MVINSTQEATVDERPVITAVACGRAHTLAATQDGRLYTWGCGRHGELGHGDKDDQMVPKLVEAVQHVRVTLVSGGDNFSAAVTEDGALFTWGLGSLGQLGHVEDELLTLPRMVAGLHGHRLREVSCGNEHIAGVSENGALYTWGQGHFGQLGHGSRERHMEPKLVEDLTGGQVLMAACGGSHTVVLLEGQIVLTFGNGSSGQLGHGDCSDQLTAKPVVDLTSKQIKHIACGSDHTAAITAHGWLFTWGCGAYGQLGHSNVDDECRPVRVNNISDVMHVACGRGEDAHTIAVTSTGYMYAWGCGQCGQLGLAVDDDWIVADDWGQRTAPEQVSSVPGQQRWVYVACGDRYSSALTDDGGLFTWGYGGMGELGHGDAQNHYSPKPVLALKVPGQARFTVQRATRPAPRVLVSAGAMRSQPPRPRHPSTGFDQRSSHENDPGHSNGTSSAEAAEDVPADSTRRQSRDRVAAPHPEDRTDHSVHSHGGVEVAVLPAGSEEAGSTRDGGNSEGHAESPQSTGTLSPGTLSPSLDPYPPPSWDRILLGAGSVEMSLPVPPGPPPEANALTSIRSTSAPTVASHSPLPVATSSLAVVSTFDPSQPSSPAGSQQSHPVQNAAGTSNRMPADIATDSNADADLDACINVMRLTMHEKLRRLRGERQEEERLRRKAEDQAVHLQLLCEGQAAQLAESTQAKESEAACCTEDTMKDHAAEFECVPKNLDRLSLVELEDLQRRVQAYTQRIDSALVRAKAANEVQMSRMCSICYDQPRSLVFVPCGHTACTNCTEELQASTTWCHQCRSPIQSVLRLHDN